MAKNSLCYLSNLGCARAVDDGVGGGERWCVISERYGGGGREEDGRAGLEEGDLYTCATHTAAHHHIRAISHVYNAGAPSVLVEFPQSRPRFSSASNKR